MWRMLTYTGLFRTISNSDPFKMAIASGKRDVGLWLLSEILEADPNIYNKMQQEAHERKY